MEALVCMSKHLGFFTLADIEVQNQAILSNQSWAIAKASPCEIGEEDENLYQPGAPSYKS